LVHIHLHVPDLTASVVFYRAFFGCDPVKTKDGYAKFLPTWAPVNLALSQHAGAQGGHVSHLGIQLPSTALVEEHLRRISASGISTRVEMGVDCCHANQDKFWIVDPTGVEWEIYHLNYDLNDATAPTSSSCCAS